MQACAMTGLRDHLPISKTLGDLIDAFLGDFARLVVLGQRRASSRARRAAGEWCFPSPRGDRPIAYAAHVWRQIVEAAGLDPAGLVVHTLRHSLATCALRAGAPLEHVATVLGHRSTAITRRIYSRPLANPGARAVVNDFARSILAHHQ